MDDWKLRGRFMKVDWMCANRFCDEYQNIDDVIKEAEQLKVDIVEDFVL